MYQDLWVASDGITTVRFSDQKSAEIYCAQTGWNFSEMLLVRQQVTVSEDGAIIVEPWCNRMDPNVECEVEGTWSETTYIPPANSMADGSTSEDDLPVTYNSAHLREVGIASELLNWDFRDLAATETVRLNETLAYVMRCINEGTKPSQQEAEKIIMRYAN